MPENTTPNTHGHHTPNGGGQVTEDQVMKALEKVDDPEIGRSIVDLQMVKDLNIDGGNVSFVLALTVPGCPLTEYMSNNAKQAVKALPGVTDVAITTRGMTDEERAEVFKRLRSS